MSSLIGLYCSTENMLQKIIIIITLPQTCINDLLRDLKKIFNRTGGHQNNYDIYIQKIWYKGNSAYYNEQDQRFFDLK